MAAKQLEAQNPLILKCNRLIDAFAKSDDERDFYIDRQEGFIIYADLDKPEDEVLLMDAELKKGGQRYSLIPKLTYYETKKIMEGFVNEKVYDVDTKDKLLDIIQSKEARENFLEFIYDHHSEFEKWQIYYQERSRVRVIEWLCANHFHFVFEEDLELSSGLIEKLKQEIFDVKVSKEVEAARKILQAKSKTYYSNEALNPRPKRGRPPKQISKVEFEAPVTTDIMLNVPNALRPFIFMSEINLTTSAFSAKFGYENELATNKRFSDNDLSMNNLNSKLAALRSLSAKWQEEEIVKKAPDVLESFDDDFDDDEDDDFDEDDDDDDEDNDAGSLKKSKSAKGIKGKAKPKKTKSLPAKKNVKPLVKVAKKGAKTEKPKSKPAVKAIKTAAKPVKAKPKLKPLAKIDVPSEKGKPGLRPIMKLKTKKKP